MLRHVIVPLDGSELSEQALKYAEEVTGSDSKMTLLSVIEVPVDYDYALVDIPLTVVSSRAYDKAEFDATYRRVHDYLLGHARKLTAKGYEVECVVESGDPASVIADIANNHNCNAVVMTTHGRTGFSRWLFGSVTQKVIGMMCCPVLVVPGTQAVQEEESATKKAAATT